MAICPRRSLHAMPLCHSATHAQTLSSCREFTHRRSDPLMVAPMRFHMTCTCHHASPLSAEAPKVWRREGAAARRLKVRHKSPVTPPALCLVHLQDPGDPVLSPPSFPRLPHCATASWPPAPWQRQQCRLPPQSQLGPGKRHPKTTNSFKRIRIFS